jgi:RNase P subunit RPR2
MNIIPLKRCTRCNQEFPATLEYFTKSGHGGLCSHCKTCRKLDRKEDRAKNGDKIRAQRKKSDAKRKDKIKAYHAGWWDEHKQEINQNRKLDYAANPLPAIERAKNYYQNNKEERIAYIKQWQQDNPDKLKEYRIRGYLRLTSEQRRVNNHNRRARIRGVGGVHTKADIKLQYKSQRGKCWHCGVNLHGTYHVDHLYPIDRGGHNGARNIVCSCPRCNWSKGDKPTWEWNGKLL